MNIFKFFKWFFIDQFTFFTGGSGGGGPTTSTTQTSNIPDYLAPYASNMLNATQSQLFNQSPIAGQGGYDVQGNQVAGGEYNAEGTKAQTEITGFKPFQKYGAQYDKEGNEIPGSYDPSKYFASTSPLQNQSYQTAANMQVPGQFGTATNMASLSGQGMLGTTGSALGYGSSGAGYGSQGSNLGVFGGAQYGSQGAGYGGIGAGLGVQGGAQYGGMGAGLGLQAAGAGQNFANQATNPAAVQAYMSPYMQNVVDYQKGQALRDYQIAAPMRQAAAVGQGAFGGNRLALQQSEAQRGLMSQLQGIEATGSQNAFQNAQAQQQFGANLGLQGLQAGMQGAGVGLQGVNTQLAGTGQGMQGAQIGLAGVDRQLAGTGQGMQGATIGLQGVAGAQAGYAGANQAAGTLGNLGAAQNQAQMGIANLQNQYGGQQQQQQQQIINQQIQDYATQQQYPMMQLGMMSNMLRGLPMQSATTQSYQALPPIGQQAMGYGLGALGAYKAFS